MREGGIERLLVRAAVAAVFAVSGIAKLVDANQGIERFARVGLPPGLATAVSAVEIGCALLLLVGLRTRLAAIPPAIVMVGALWTTKLPLLFGPGPEPLAAEPKIGVLAFLYAARLDFAMLACCVALAIAGGGRYALDARGRG